MGCVLAVMAESCPRLASVTFSGWKSFTSDDLLFIAEQFKELRRLDLSSINVKRNLPYDRVRFLHCLLFNSTTHTDGNQSEIIGEHTGLVFDHSTDEGPANASLFGAQQVGGNSADCHSLGGGYFHL